MSEERRRKSPSAGRQEGRSKGSLTEDNQNQHCADVKPDLKDERHKENTHGDDKQNAKKQIKINKATLDVFFDGEKYYRQEKDGSYHRLTREDARLHLRILGLNNDRKSDVSEVDLALYKIQHNNRVTYAASFCGRPAGCYNENGNQILAIDGPKMTELADGDPRALTTFFSNLLGRDRDPLWEKQYLTFIAWLKRAREALHHPNQHLPGQMLALIGPTDCGKTLCQTIITRCMGGREADPSLWLQGKTTFNDPLWGSEHLVLSDANLEEKYEARKALRDKIKEIVANAIYPCHRKHKRELSLRPIWRITLSANDDAYSAFVLPHLDRSLADKVIYLKCHPPLTPFPTVGGEDSDRFFNKLIDAIPAFLKLVDNYEIPDEYRKGRFGVYEFHHPDILEILEELSPDSAIGEVLMNYQKQWDCEQKEIGATVLYEELNKHTNGNLKRHGISNNPTHLGVQLRRMSHSPAWRGLITSNPKRIGKNKQLTTIWIIKNPEKINHQVIG